MIPRVGMVLHGYCGGCFEQDPDGSKRIEALGVDWVVTRNEFGDPEFAAFGDGEGMDELLVKWSRTDAD